MTLTERVALHDKQLAAHEKQMKAMRELVHEGLRLVRQILVIQKRTDEKLETLINTMRRGGNGHGRKKFDLE
jgi:hypothetical protein